MENQLSKTRKWITLINILLATFMSTLDSSIVNINLPIISKELNVTIDAVSLVVTLYLFTICLFLLAFGKASDIFNKKVIFLIGFIIFTTGSLLCGISYNFKFLIFSRIVQAIGASALMALPQGIITSIFSSNERGKALGISGTTVSLGILLGPSIGGLLVHNFNWQSIFLVNIPIGILGILMTIFTMPTIKNFSKSHNKFIDLKIFKNTVFTIGVTTAFMSFVATNSFILFIPFYFRYVMAYDVLKSGLLLSFYPLTTAVLAPFSGWLSDKFSYKYLTLFGLAINTTVLFCFRIFSRNMSYAKIVFFLILIGVGSALFQAPNNNSVMSSVEKEQLGTASSLTALFRNAGMMLGSFLSVIIFTLTSNTNFKNLSKKNIGINIDDFLSGFKYVLLFSSISCLVAFILNLIRVNKRLPIESFAIDKH